MYGTDLLSDIFILGLEDVYTRKQLFQLKPMREMTTVSFEKLVSTASEIATAKDNVAEALNTTISGISGDKNKAVICEFCNSSGFTEEVRKKQCKAWGQSCNE